MWQGLLGRGQRKAHAPASLAKLLEDRVGGVSFKAPPHRRDVPAGGSANPPARGFKGHSEAPHTPSGKPQILKPNRWVCHADAVWGRVRKSSCMGKWEESACQLCSCPPPPDKPSWGTHWPGGREGRATPAPTTQLRRGDGPFKLHLSSQTHTRQRHLKREQRDWTYFENDALLKRVGVRCGSPAAFGGQKRQQAEALPGDGSGGNRGRAVGWPRSGSRWSGRARRPSSTARRCTESDGRGVRTWE